MCDTVDCANICALKVIHISFVYVLAFYEILNRTSQVSVLISHYLVDSR